MTAKTEKTAKPEKTTVYNAFPVTGTKRFPLYMKYPEQHCPQPAYLLLDTRTGEVTADYSGEVGGSGQPEVVWHGLVRRYAVYPYMTREQVTQVIDSFLPDFQTLLDGCEVSVWNGNNYVTRVADELHDFEYDLVERIDQASMEAAHGTVMIDDLSQYLNGAWFPQADTEQSLEGFVHAICFGLDTDELLSDDLNSTDRLKDAVLDIWAGLLEDGEELPVYAAQALLEDGRCHDSGWYEDLKAYAAA